MFEKQILDTNPQLFFHLQQQRLIELIRAGKVEEALEFAQEELAPRGEENVRLFCLFSIFLYVRLTERVMFPHSLPGHCPGFLVCCIF